MEFLVPVFVAIFIFFMSAVDGVSSAVQSEIFVRIVRILPIFRTMSLQTVQIIVRKFAHAFEYAALGGSTTWAFRKPLGEKSKYLAFILSTAFACSDEIHQLFVAGRGGCIQDVLVDTIGALIGISLVKLFSKS